ncbi:MAG: hypothetical protein GY863_11300 [bacterium]|nr:hypothetical protein [bacterium]
MLNNRTFVFSIVLSILLFPAVILADGTRLDHNCLTKKTINDGPSLLLQEPPQQEEEVDPGGYIVGLKALLFGPRVGLEANEGTRISFVEKANLFVPLSPFQAYSVNGIKGFLASAFLGPRVGMQLKERKIRKKEWLGLIPVIAVTYHLFSSDPSTSMVLMEVAVAGLLSRILPAWEAFRGKTMTEVHRRENLQKN